MATKGATELDREIEQERAPAQARGDRIKALSKALLAGPDADTRAKLQAELDGLKAQRCERSPRLVALLAERSQLRREQRAAAEKGRGDCGDLSQLPDEELASMRTKLVNQVLEAQAKLGTIGAEVTRRQSRSAAISRLDKMSREEQLALAQELKSRGIE
jgi:capsule polysaccharide export protein KpsE/RkpR